MKRAQERIFVLMAIPGTVLWFGDQINGASIPTEDGQWVTSETCSGGMFGANGSRQLETPCGDAETGFPFRIVLMAPGLITINVWASPIVKLMKPGTVKSLRFNL